MINHARASRWCARLVAVFVSFHLLDVGMDQHNLRAWSSVSRPSADIAHSQAANRRYRVQRACGPGGVLPDGELRDAYDPVGGVTSVVEREGAIPLFASPIYRKQLRENADEIVSLNDEIAEMFTRIRARDEEGQEWCKEQYSNGYTSYYSLPTLQNWIPAIQKLEEWLEPHIQEFRRHAMMEDTPKLFMTDSWANVMGDGTKHGWHQHNKSTISGTYYVRTPPGCSGLLFGEPPLDRSVAQQERQLIECPAKAGYVILFESWQRHTVPPNQASVDWLGARDERISVSFNYHWQFEEPTQLE